MFSRLIEYKEMPTCGYSDILDVLKDQNESLSLSLSCDKI